MLILDHYPKSGTLAVSDIMLAKKLRENLCPQSIKKMILCKWVVTSHSGFSSCQILPKTTQTLF